MEKAKRRPIRIRILVIIIIITVASLVSSSTFGILSMLGIRREAVEALTDQARDNLSWLIESKTELADMKFRKYQGITSQMAESVEDIIANPEQNIPRAIRIPPDPDNAGKLTIQVALRDESVNWENVKNDAEILANAASRFAPIMNENRDVITTVYFGLEDGYIICYDDQSDIKSDMYYFDYTETEWYKLGKEKKTVSFTDAYTDHFGRGVTITCVSPLYGKDGKFVGVIGIDILINDLYADIIDLDLGGGASVLIASENGKLISPTEDPENSSIEAKDILPSERQRAENYSSGITLRDNMILAFTTIECVNWKLFVRVPQSNILVLANNMNDYIASSITVFFIFILIVIIVVVVVAYEFSEKITRPIIDLTKDVGEISGGDLDHRARISGNDEIGDLAEQFNEMAGSLKEHIGSLTAVTAEKERIGAELDIAAKIQADTLPVNFPDRNDIRLYATMTPAKEVGGDFYDFFMIDDDHIALVMADVSGKGVPAALFMVMAKTVIHDNSVVGGNTGEILMRVNEELNLNNRTGFFVTVWLGILTISTGELRFSNAGHEYPAIKRGNGNYELYRTDNFPPLAIQEGIEYEEDSITLEEGDRIFLYTDGVPDAKSPEGERFGTNKMLGFLNGNKNYDMISTLTGMKEYIDDFISGSDPFDDITMLGLIWFGKK